MMFGNLAAALSGFLSARRRNADLAHLTYGRIVAAARSPALYLQAGVPDNGAGRFEMLALHAFVLLNRMAGDAGWRDVGTGLADVMIADLEASLREMGAGDMAIGRKVKTLARGLYGRFDAYWGALHGPEAAHVEANLTAALARNVYADVTEGENLAARFMTPYLLRQIDVFAAMADENLRRGDFCFIDAEDFFASPPTDRDGGMIQP